MSSIQKVRTYVYDTPATYNQFDGGINTNLSNEALEPNELRDGLNCHYVNKSIVNRKGEKIIKHLNLPVFKNRYQGDFIFSAPHNDYIISVRNGNIYYGLYTPKSFEIDMIPVNIEYTTTTSRDDPANFWIDINVVTQDRDHIHPNYSMEDTEGYIYKYYTLEDEWPDNYNLTLDDLYLSDKTYYIKDGDEYIALVPGTDYVVGTQIPLDASGVNSTIYDYTTVTEDDYQYTLRCQNTRPVQGVPSILVNDKGETSFTDTNGKTVINEPTFILATGTRIIQIRELQDEENPEYYYLYAYVLKGYKPNSWDIQNIGVNNLSPFPNYYYNDTEEVPKTSIGALILTPHQLDSITINDTSKHISVKAIVNTMKGFTKSDLYYKWEAKLGPDSNWTVVHYWKASLNNNQALSALNGTTSQNKTEIKIPNTFIKNTLNGGLPLQPGMVLYVRCTLTSDFQVSYSIEDESYSYDYDEAGDYVADQAVAQYSKTHSTFTVSTKKDANGNYIAYSPSNAQIDQQFLYIHSCVKVVSDGTKLLFYDDIYDSCQWFKTVTGQNNYLSYGGNLEFRTNKNEKLIAVVPYDSTIVVFSDNEQLGGNISVVTGNGDDYNNGEYYSPYKRQIVNTAVSCDCFNSIQIAENFIIFKYRNDIYLLNTNDLDGERVQVITINDKVKQKLSNIEFPLERIREPYKGEDFDNDFHEYSKCLKPTEIFSEVCDGYYGIVFPHQGFHMDTFEWPEEGALKPYEGDNEEYIERLNGAKIDNRDYLPGVRWKCYFRKGMQYSNNEKPFYPWLRDVSKYLNIVNIINIAGESTMIDEQGNLIQFNNEDYSGLDEFNYKVRITTRCYDMELPTLCKFLDNANVYFNRDFEKNLYLNCTIKNEAAFEVYNRNIEAYVDSINNKIGFDERYTMDDALNLREEYLPLDQYDDTPYVDPMQKPVQIINDTPVDTATLDRPSFTSVTLTPKYRFPYLSAQLILEMRSNQAFSLSAITFSFTSHDMPDFTREKLYRDILTGNILQ